MNAPHPFEHWRVTATDPNGADEVTYRKATLYTVISPDGRRGLLVPRAGEYRFAEQLALIDPMEGFTLTAPQGRQRASAPRQASLQSQQGLLFNPARVLAGQMRPSPDGRMGIRTTVAHHGKRREVWVIVPPELPDWRADFAAEPRKLRRPLARPAGARGGPLTFTRPDDPRPHSRAYLPSGDAVEVAWEVVDLADLITSHDPWTLQVRPEFPAALQPRDRSRKSYHDQIARLVAGFNPDLLTWSATASDGAPIIGPHGVVESGNGRTMALSRVYRDGGAKAQAYRQTVAAWAAELGLKMRGKHPVLVRKRVSEIDPAEFARAANVSQMQGMAASETAIADAAAMTAGLVELLEPGAELGTMANARFVEAFIAQVAGRGARGQMLDPRGKLSKDGEIRLDLALFAFAYGPEAQILITDLAEVRESELKTVLTAMVTAAPYVARLRADIATGRFDASLDPSAELTKFATAMRSARLANLRIDEFLRQTDAFSAPSEATFLWKQALYPTARASGRALADAIAAYVAHARRYPAGQMDFFGNTTPSQTELIQRALRGPPGE